ncbi:MAG: PilZ domain-containing protein [Archangium sp.]|nr:PilZ domain-containing protein [Archangium sp.]
MHDAHSKSGSISSSVSKRSTKSTAAGKFSPSFGVRRGLIKDPNWPPAQFPEHGTAASRRFRRVDTKFIISVRGEEAEVKGDVSEGGAMFLLDRRLDAKTVHVMVGGKAARAEILSCSKKGNAYAHHCRFTSADEAQPVWAAVAIS